MVIQKTSKDILSKDDILKYIADYEVTTVPILDNLWEYYKGKNVKILKRKAPDPNNPDNKIVISYGRKLITTWAGYGYRPKFITYKPNVTDNKEETEDEENKQLTIEEKFHKELMDIFAKNNEHIKTSKAGRNTGIFGLSYELLYIDGEDDKQLNTKAVPRFFTVDPREMILLYDYSPEPKKKIAIRFYKTDEPNKYIVEVYYDDKIDTYFRILKDDGNWELQDNKLGMANFYKKVPIAAYYIGDDIQSIIQPILTTIDAYDVLFSDSMNEFDRFAFAYLIMKKFGLSSPTDNKDPTKVNMLLQLLKRRRMFEHLDKDAEIKFLTKDIPTAFIQHIGKQLKEEIHSQSHIPDFNQMTGALSGAAVDRLLFDFENLVSSAEAEFDVGLCDRINLIAGILKITKSIEGAHDMISISHKRNKPLNTKDFADTALTMQQGGFSRRAIVSTMPEDIIPDVDEELRMEKEEMDLMIGEDNINNTIEDEGPVEEEINTEEEQVNA